MRDVSLKKAQKEFKRAMAKFIRVNSRPVTVLLPEIKSDCPNCLNDIMFGQDESINKYNESFLRPVNIFPGTSDQQIIYPVPFNLDTMPSGVVIDPSILNPKVLRTTVCPVCKGKGYLASKPTVCVYANFNWHPGRGKEDGKIVDYSAGRLSENIGIIKADLKYYAIFRDGIGFVVEGGVECEKITSPEKRGVGIDAHIEVYVQKVDLTDATSRICDQDARLNVTPLGEVSEQAEQSDPYAPPSTFSDEDW